VGEYMFTIGDSVDLWISLFWLSFYK